MLIAFTGASGRTDASHASLLAAHAALVVDGRATLVLPDDAPGPQAGAGLHVVRVSAAEAADRIWRVADACRDGGGTAVADLPSAWLRDGALRAHLDAAVLVVGPHAADEREAAGWSADGGETFPTWYLGCRRAGGGPAAARFAAAIMELDPRAAVMPYALPPLGRGEATALNHGSPRGRTLRTALLLMAAMRHGAVAGRFAPLEAAAPDEAGRIAVAADVRSFPERLRDLADDVEAVEAGLKPEASDLADAPVLDGWSCDAVAAPILKGRVSGHPGIAEGHRVRTSEVYLTDRRTYARTLSRWYVLRSTAGEPDAGLQ
ncbi:hypothetical protein [Methylobacterium oryzae]|uniref:Uncharacterized protein n=1 Tax=Methylobacterium oryzae TaxID=334852 RepID=A0ABU7TRX1_9HYPH